MFPPRKKPLEGLPIPITMAFAGADHAIYPMKKYASPVEAPFISAQEKPLNLWRLPFLQIAFLFIMTRILFLHTGRAAQVALSLQLTGRIPYIHRPAIPPDDIMPLRAQVLELIMAG